MLEHIKEKKVLVLGLGKSGLSSARLLLEKGAAKVVASDSREIDFLGDEARELGQHDRVELVCGGHPETLLEGVSALIKSPGIKPQVPLLVKAEKARIPVFSEIELAYHFCSAPIVGITGTNGKTTTTSLAAEMFKKSCQGTVAAGNIGYPLCDAVRKVQEGGWIVAELSSFQLDNTVDFKPHIAVVLNITPDHLDYHGKMEQYVVSKKKILQNQGARDWAVLNWDDPAVREFAPFVRSNLLYFSLQESPRPGIYLEEGKIKLVWDEKKKEFCDIAEVCLPGRHNLENALAASAAAWAGGVQPEHIASALREFQGVPHRLEPVGEIDGVLFINDSKGTNPEAALKAFQAVEGPKILIAGGLDKGGEFSSMLRAMAGGALKKIVLLGETAPKMEIAAREAGINEVEIAENLPAAVNMAFHSAEPGDRVLLSPGCASWDMFRDYEERGHVFKKAFAALKEGRK